MVYSTAQHNTMVYSTAPRAVHHHGSASEGGRVGPHVEASRCKSSSVCLFTSACVTSLFAVLDRRSGEGLPAASGEPPPLAGAGAPALRALTCSSRGPRVIRTEEVTEIPLHVC
eukprot:COSAG01_NODE_1550_length_9943_cov_233.259651_9_plen_114_part_00